MSYQVIKQPDGKLAIFSTETDTWSCWDGTPDEVVGWFAEQAAQDARTRAQSVVDRVLDGTPQKVYFQFAMTFAEANARSRHHGGEVLEGPLDEDLYRELESFLDVPDAG